MSEKLVSVYLVCNILFGMGYDLEYIRNYLSTARQSSDGKYYSSDLPKG